MYKFYQTAPVLRGLLFLSTPISAEDAKTPVAKCVESCAEVAEELARQERPSVESTQSGTGGSETGIVTQPVLDANQILDFYKCPWQNPLALVDPISGYWELICFVSLIAGDTGYAADKLTETDHRLNAGLIPSPASPPRFSGRSQGRMLLSVP